MRYLKRKNWIFYKTVEELITEKELAYKKDPTYPGFFIQYWTNKLEKDTKIPTLRKDIDCYDLIVVNFTDEEEYQRSITIPYPIFFASRSKGALLLRKWIAENGKEVVVCDRENYERFGWRIQEEQEVI